MANNKRCCCCDGNEHQIEVKKLSLDDGRRAERHTSFDENGKQIVEIFAEEKRPLKLEKRIIREHKEYLAKETHETVKDGQVVLTEVLGGEPEPVLQMRERIATAEHDKVFDGDYMKREEVGKVVSDAVVDGITALMDSMGGSMMHYNQPQSQSQPEPEPYFTAQSIVEQNVVEKKQEGSMTNFALAGILIAQIALFGYMFFVM